MFDSFIWCWVYCSKSGATATWATHMLFDHSNNNAIFREEWWPATNFSLSGCHVKQTNANIPATTFSLQHFFCLTQSPCVYCIPRAESLLRRPSKILFSVLLSESSLGSLVLFSCTNIHSVACQIHIDNIGTTIYFPRSHKKEFQYV